MTITTTPLYLFLFYSSRPDLIVGLCSRHNSTPASSVINFVFARLDSSHVSVDTVHRSMCWSSSPYSPKWYHLHCLSSDVFLVSSLEVPSPPQSRFPAPLCCVLYLQSLPYVIFSHMVYCSFMKITTNRLYNTVLSFTVMSISIFNISKFSLICLYPRPIFRKFIRIPRGHTSWRFKQ